MVGKLEDIGRRHGRAVEQVANPVGLEVAREQPREIPVADPPADLDHLRAVVVFRVAVVGMRMQPTPAGSEEVRGAARLADLDGNAGGPGRRDQRRRSTGRIALGPLDRRTIEDEAIGREATEDRGHRPEVVEVRMAHDDRLDASHPGRSQRRNDRADSERGVIETSRVEHHRP